MKNKVLNDTFSWLFIGLLICFGSSYLTTQVEAIWNVVYTPTFVFGSIIAELVIALVLAVRITKMGKTTATMLYIAYTILTGMSLSWIFLAYTGGSITFAFLAASIIFGIFALIGAKTDIDLSQFGLYLFVALIGIIIVTIINIFIGSDTLTMILCIISILVFAGYTAFDIKVALNKTEMLGENAGIYCAFQLFLDFINIFIDLLRLFGKRDN